MAKVLFLYKNVTLTEPMGILYLAAALSRAGHETRLALAERENPAKAAEEFDPEVLAFSTTTGFHHYYLDLNRRLKNAYRKPGLLSIFGGPHCTFFPELVEEDGVDVVCRGEGEEAIVDLANALDASGDTTNIPNLWVKSNGSIYRNDVRPLVDDLDGLPHPRRDIIYDIDPYMRNVTMKHFINVRGCPYLCTYCFNHKFNELYKGKGKVIRYRSVDDVLAEIKEVRAEYPLKFVRFLSDNFTMDKGWTAEFAERYRKEIGLPFHCNVRANLIDGETARNLGRAGCVSAMIGIETADDYVRNEVLKRNQTDETIIEACRRLRANGVALYTTNIIGLPGERFDGALKTVELNVKCKPSFAWAGIFMPYPDTELSKYAIEHGYFDGDYDRIHYSFHERSELRFDDVGERRTISRLHKLFGLAVEFGFIRRRLRYLCKLPLTALYTLLFKLWYGYTNRYRIFPYPITAKQYLSGVFRFFRKDEA
jgi:anaerobic magnesium-protoporphyrin IX monomethyl ester cyclase